MDIEDMIDRFRSKNPLLEKIKPVEHNWTRVKIDRDPTLIANALFQAGLKRGEDGKRKV